ncbi:hypothetical protein DM01DRAFT_360705 [Hesseltinella vesiculosa]|uniref:Rpr2-domain-containing protein n=1 Tax=Hesseltinella vesiculosa TaxID=101127 RepID=A0A1X2G501_9FUNG|nr:hypothetical protein DM01DRAFT_360705 [Hesseltinella vesiculosa]
MSSYFCGLGENFGSRWVKQAAADTPNINLTTQKAHQASSKNAPKTDIKWQASQDLHPLARYYNTNMKKIGRRLVIRVDPHIKRSICKRCDTPLLPVATSTTRSKEDHTLCIDRPDRLLQPTQDDVDLLPTKGQPEASSVQQQQGM